MAIKALVLDLDGTLYSASKVLDVDSAAVPRVHAYLRRKGLLAKVPKPEMAKIDREVTDGKLSENIRTLCERFHLDFTNFNDYANNLEPGDFGIRKDARLISLLTRASKHYKLFIFTNAPEIWAKKVLTRVGISRLIPLRNIINSDRMGTYFKPHQQAYRIMLGITCMKGSEIIFIDDRQENIVVARKMGIKALKANNTYGNKRNSVYSILGSILKQSRSRR